MVIKSKIYDFLKESLGEYLYGFEKNQLDVGLLSGHIELVNVNFRPDKVNELLESNKFPIHIKAGLMGKMRLKCHYTSFLSSPVEAEIDELLLVFGPIPHTHREKHRVLDTDEEELIRQIEKEEEIFNYNKTRPKLIANSGSMFVKASNSEVDRSYKGSKHSHKENDSDIDNIKKSSKRRSSKMSKQEESDKEKKRRHRKHNDNHEPDKLRPSDFVTNEFQFESNNPSRKNTENREPPIKKELTKKGLLEKYFTKVLKNLTLTVKTVHISYEDETYPYQNPFSFGFSLEKLEVKNISQEWGISNEKQVKKPSRKNSTIKELIFQNAAVYIYSMASAVIPTSLWEATIDSEIGIFEAFPAYEVRDLIIQQSSMLSKSHPSTFIEPTHGKICIILHEEAPTMKASGYIERIKCKLTPSMTECIRHFFDYCTNVQIWRIISRHRPEARIPERPAKREHRKERRKRREIVREWFQYAFKFVKTKLAAMKYIKAREKEKEIINRLEKQEKIRKKLVAQHTKVQEEKPAVVQVADNSKTSSLFSFNRQRKVPGVSGLKLDTLSNGVKKPISAVKEKRPYDGEKYFPKYLNNSELEIFLGTFSMSIIDEDTGIQVELNGCGLTASVNTLMDECTAMLSLGEYCIAVCDQNKQVEALKSAKKGPKPVASAMIIYRPAEILIPNDIYLSLNMYESTLEFSPMQITYTHNILNHVFLIKESFTLDKCFRENLNSQYIKSFLKQCKKRKIPKVFGVELSKFALAKKISLQLIEYQTHLEEKIIELNNTVSPILFNLSANFEGGCINFHDFSPNALASIDLPNFKLAVGKDKENAFISAFGIELKSGVTPMALYDFLMTLGNIAVEKLKTIRTLTSFKHIN